MRKTLWSGCAVASLSLGTSLGAITFDSNVTPDAIFGSGNVNGSYTVDRANGVELGLRGKLRHNTTGAPENTFNSNGDGTYSFSTGVAPTQPFPTAVWSFEWSINSNYDNSSGWNLNDLTYLLEIDSDSSQDTSFSSFDPINLPFADHAIGDNSTANGGGLVALDATEYTTNISSNNVAQNSWKAHWFLGPAFDPTVDGTYDFRLSAFDSGGDSVASTQMQIIAGAGGASVPDGGSMMLMLGGSLLGLAGIRRLSLRKA